MDMNNLIGRFTAQYGGALPFAPQMPSFGAVSTETPIQPQQPVQAPIQEPTYSTPEGEFVGPKAPSKEEMAFAKNQSEFQRLQKKYNLNEEGVGQGGKFDGQQWYGPETKAWVRSKGLDNIKKKTELMEELDYRARNEARKYAGLDPLPELEKAPQKEGKPLPFGDASKLAALTASYQQIQDLADGLFDKDTGDFKRGDVALSKIPGTKEAMYELKAMQAVEAWLRAMTGAAIQREERQDYSRMYLPQPWDEPSVALDKLARIESQYLDTLANMGQKDRIDATKSKVAAVKKLREQAKAASGNKESKKAANDESEWEDVK